MGSPWQYLGHFRRQETSPSASSQAIHTPHLPSLNCVAIKASQSHLPPCTAQWPGRAELVRAYHLFPDSEGASVLKFSFLQPFLCSVSNLICIFFAYYLQWQSGKKHHLSWRSSTGRGLDVSSFCHISRQTWTSGHNEQDDFYIHVRYQARAPVLHLQDHHHPHYISYSTWKHTDDLRLSKSNDVLLSNLIDWTLIF